MIPQNKAELIKEIEASHQKLRIELGSIPEKISRKKELTAHAKDTKMSVCDLVAYLIGWGELVLKWHRLKTKGQSVDFPETGYKWNELGKLAKKFYADYKDYSYNDLLKKYNKVVTDILKLIKAQDNRVIYHVPWYGKWTLARMIQFNTSSPYKNAYTRIRKYKKYKGL